MSMHPVSAALPIGDDLASPRDDRRLLLRDGSVATVRPSVADDRASLHQFFHELSDDSRRRRFFTASFPADSYIERLCDSSDPSRGVTLIVHRSVSDVVRPIAVASYAAITSSVAEVAFAVADSFQGKGVATALLERLAFLAAQAGFQKFQATTLADNSGMLEVFRDSGFEIRTKSGSGCIELQMSLLPSAQGVAASEERTRVATAASLRPMFSPQSVVVVGVSRDESSIGRRVFDALVRDGFAGPIYPVNAAATEIAGRRCYQTVRDVPAGADLAVVAVPPDAVLGVVDDCARVGIKSLVVITAGFAEAGERGRALQQQLVDRVRSYGMRLVGPNCMGLLNAASDVRLNASFSPIFPLSGSVGLSSQSGALGLSIIEQARQRHVGLSTFVSVGNKADVSGNDLLQYWESDPATSVILLYLESFGNPRRFARLARRITPKKPIVAVKAGRTRAGSRAAGSHTAALAANDVAVKALFEQTGVIRAETIDEMFDLAACLEAQPLPLGRRVGIVTNAGGPGILAVDACEGAGLAVAEFNADTRARLKEFLPPEASVGNPVDMVASAGPEQYRRTIELLLSASETDAVIVIYTPVDTRSSTAVHAAIGQGIAAARRAGVTTKPVLACVMAEPGQPVPLEVEGEKIPTYAFPENAARALGKVAAYAVWRAQPPGLLWSFDDIRPDQARQICHDALAARGDGWLSTEEARAVLTAFALPVAAGTVARSADEAAALAAVVGFPVAAKLASRRIQHKTEIGAVRLNLANAQAVRRAYADIVAHAKPFAPADALDGVLIQAMIGEGVETMIGISDDPSFGPLVAFGLGGIHVEILGDVRFRIAPLTDRDVDELLHGIRGFPLLQGYRGRTPADLDALRDVLLRMSRLAEEVPEIKEVDLNPVIALAPGKGCRIVDARIRVANNSGIP